MDTAGLPPLELHNSTDHRCEGVVAYDDGLEESFVLLAWERWSGIADRGSRQVRRISVKVRRSTGLQTDAEAFHSSGSPAHRFAILRCAGTYLVTRIDQGGEGSPADP